MGEEMHDRLNAAERLVKDGKYDAATAEFVWLWENMERVDPDMSGVRVSFMAKYIEDLVEKHPPTRQRFREIRDRTAMLAETDATDTARLRFDWIVLNDIVGEQERTLTWFDGIKENERYGTLLDKVASRLIPLLEAKGRVRDVGRLYKDPVAHLAKLHFALRPPPSFKPEVPAGLPANLFEMVTQSLAESFRDDAALMVAGLLAAGRTTEADAVEREALRRDASEAMRAALQKARGKLD